MSGTFTVHYVGSEAEVAHHAAPLQGSLSVEVTLPDRVAEVARPGDVAIFFSEHFERFRRAIGELRQRGIATLYALDGILEWRHTWENRSDEPACPWTMRPVLSHKVACIGKHQASILRSWGNGSKIEVVGLPRLDAWAGDADSNLPGAKIESIAAPRSPSDQPLRILVATAKFPGFTPAQTETTLQSLRDLRAWFAQHPQVAGRPIEVRWRLTRGLEQQLDVPNALHDVNGAESIAQIQEADVVISTPSTLLLESMLLGRPTVLLDYHAYPSYVPAAWTLRHAGDFDSILSSAAAVDARRMAYQRFLLHEELECATPALPRLIQVITALHRSSRNSEREPGAGEQLPRDLLQEDSPLARLTTAELTTWFPEHFAEIESSSPEAAAELAHTRREIENLHLRIAQLSSELASAHDIFRQIHAHPIAGPVVRTRQRLLDLVQHWSGPRGRRDQGRL